MKFRPRQPEEPQIDLVPFIDVLLVILIFLMLTTTYNRFTELQLTLPVANADAAHDRPKEIVVAVAADGRYAVDKQPLAGRSAEAVADALRAAQPAPDTVLIISADAAATHQAVVTAMEAARRLGLTRITFAAQTGAAR
ncbi:MAG: biopolymer transporter ExbD [Burkholderiaceae bacterium]|nr:biopolymer transporter ExbD [Pseudomonadota bacterium]MCP5218086.1 biopolymer transporter ExbD [Burkholderiaceae bacterium]